LGAEDQSFASDTAAFLLVQVIYFLVSWFVEGLILRYMLSIPARTAKKAAFLANATSYAIVSTFIIFIFMP
jgi:hypothetical protein